MQGADAAIQAANAAIESAKQPTQPQSPPRTKLKPAPTSPSTPFDEICIARQQHAQQLTREPARPNIAPILEELLPVSLRYQTTRTNRRTVYHSLQFACLKRRTTLFFLRSHYARSLAPKFRFKPVLLELQRSYPVPLQPCRMPAPISTGLPVMSQPQHQSTPAITPSPFPTFRCFIQMMYPCDNYPCLCTTAGHSYYFHRGRPPDIDGSRTSSYPPPLPRPGPRFVFL